jgi:hypothetical protein
MSTKIYDAYYVPHGMDGVLAVKKIIEHKYEEYVLYWLDKFKDRTGKDLIYQKHLLQENELHFLESINTYRKPQLPEWEYPLKEMGVLEIEWIIRANSRNMEKGVPLDFNFQMVVFYYHRKVYVQFFNFNYWWNDTFKELRKARKITDFHYQDQVDKSACISDEAWYKRAGIWEGIYKEHESEVPSCCGFSVDFIDRLQHIIMRWHNLLYRGSLDAW